MTIQKHTMVWEGIEIELTYDPAAWGGVTAHLEVRSISPDCAPLPITETGYLSHYHPCGAVEANESTLIEQVTAWLGEAAKSNAWQAHLRSTRQMSLF